MKLNSIRIPLLLVASILSVNCFAERNEPSSTTNGKLAIVPLDAEESTYTGKPYDASLKSYVFACRTYNPAVSRWLSADPTGYPDGANNHQYAAVPTIELDPLGLYLDGTSRPAGATRYFGLGPDIDLWNLGQLQAGPLMTAAMLHAEAGTNWTLNSTEIAAVKGASVYDDFRADVQGVADFHFKTLPIGSSYYTYGPNNYTFPKGSDGYYGFGDVRLSAAGFGVVEEGGGIATTTWTYYADVSLSDTFTFAPYATVPWYTPTGVGYRLETNGWIFPFSTSGSWQDTWSE